MMNDQERDAMLVSIKTALSDNTRKTEQILTAFPSGDTDGHRRYHEAVIEWRELRNKLVREALIKVTQAGALAGAGWVALAMWQALKVTVKQ
ncbi:hypothetical protein INH39_02815 [Massilia violaceinigra]|uniref:Uncharacterized protein n=1 Tax=Massilia violaceinigra TaxID=2045208 RepID=A0ABY4A7E3_9BURK|nr:hypothetical protein [Massilia violaceinigra]UOD30695.1 hypothetical protein INH39_02815 [Massilia violaceinigra]